MGRIGKWVLLAALVVIGVIGFNFVYGWSAPGPNPREVTVLLAFAAGVLVLGVWPKPLTDLMQPAIEHLVTLIASSKIPGP